MRLKTKSKPVVTDVPSSGVQAPKIIEKNKNSVPRCLGGVFVIYPRHKHFFPCNICKDMIKFVQAGINNIIPTQLSQQERYRVHISCEISMSHFTGNVTLTLTFVTTCVLWFSTHVECAESRSTWIQHIIKTWYVLKSTFFFCVFFFVLFFLLFCFFVYEVLNLTASEGVMCREMKFLLYLISVIEI